MGINHTHNRHFKSPLSMAQVQLCEVLYAQSYATLTHSESRREKGGHAFIFSWYHSPSVISNHFIKVSFSLPAAGDYLSANCRFKKIFFFIYHAHVSCAIFLPKLTSGASSNGIIHSPRNGPAPISDMWTGCKPVCTSLPGAGRGSGSARPREPGC